MQIDAGLGQVVATDTSQTPYYLVGNEWIRLPGSLRHITVGPAGIWGVSNGNLMFKYVAGNWAQFASKWRTLLNYEPREHLLLSFLITIRVNYTC
jgi:hypothetical protein